MDDIWVFRSDEGTLRAIQSQIESLLRELGLDINTAKTSVLSGDALKEEVLNFAHSGAEGALLQTPIDDEPLRRLIDELVNEPESSSRSRFSFVFRRMRKHNVLYRLHDLIEVAHRAPHAADAYARLLRETGSYKQLHSWFLAHWKSSWAVSDWATAALGLMIPAANLRKPLRQRLAEEVATPGGSLALTSFAASRLAAKAPEEYRSAIRSAINESNHPLERRALALASVTCGEERMFVRRALSEFEENQPILAMLEANSFSPPRFSKDFAGG